jgi:hypothetical protein
MFFVAVVSIQTLLFSSFYLYFSFDSTPPHKKIKKLPAGLNAKTFEFASFNALVSFSRLLYKYIVHVMKKKERRKSELRRLVGIEFMLYSKSMISTKFFDRPLPLSANNKNKTFIEAATTQPQPQSSKTT